VVAAIQLEEKGAIGSKTLQTTPQYAALEQSGAFKRAVDRKILYAQMAYGFALFQNIPKE